MKLKLYLLFFVAFYGLPGVIYGQYSGDIMPVNPVTPNEAAMFKPVAQPIGSFSGTVPIDIPLFNSGMPALPVPVTLSYNASGFKVEEYAGSTGLGWNVTVGGSVTRILHGLPDDAPSVGYMNHPSYKPSQVLGYVTYSQLEPVMNDVRNGDLDLQPDEFFFTCNGLSGKFFFDENGQVHVEENNGLTVAVVLDGSHQINGWIITDTKGNKYYFGKGHHTTETVIDQNSVTFSSSNGYTNIPPSQIYNVDWHLIEIDDINGHVMATFAYTAAIEVVDTRMEAYIKLQTGTTAACLSNSLYPGDETFASSTVYASVLTSISTPVDKLTFYGDYNRIDDQGAYELDSIRQTDLNGNLKKMFHFNYGYFYQPYYPSGQESLYWRLKLLNVAEFGTTRDSLAHKFDYLTTYNLPSRMSRGQDYWGYYNGQDNNWTLMPNGSYAAMGVTVSEGTLGERRPSFPICEADMLTTIHFPTGGTRTFTYEPNQYLWDPSSTARPDAQYYQDSTLYCSSFNTTNPSRPQYQAYFHIHDLSGGTSWSFEVDGCCFYGSYSVKILDSAGFTTYITFTNQQTGSFSLQNGAYQVQFTFSDCTITDFTAAWDQLQMNTATQIRFGRSLYQDNMTGPGVRVKQIDDYDPVSGQTISTGYQYNQFSDSALTSGLLINPVSVLTDMSCLACVYYRLSANSNYPLNQQGGNFVNYTDVRTYQTGNGHLDRQYSFDFDNMQGDPDGVLSVPQDNSWRRGKLLCARYYDNSNNLLREDSTIYEVLAGNSTFYLNLSGYQDTISYANYLFKETLGFRASVWLDPEDAGLLDYCYSPSFLTSVYCQPDYTVSHIYTPAGNQMEKTNYSYWTAIGQPCLKSGQRLLNNSTTAITNYRYAFNASGDFKLPMSAGDLLMADTLLSFNYLAPIEISQFKQQGTDTSFVEGTKYSFGNFSGYHYPILTRHYTTLTNYTDMNYVYYDSSGNLGEHYKTGDPHTVWIWGYSRTEPVAKVVGSTYSSAIAYANYSVLQYPSSDNDIRTQVGNIRSGLAGSKAQVTAYSWVPLFGISSQVDPAGIVTYYEYDNHGRLLTIRDQYNNIIKRYNYSLNNP